MLLQLGEGERCFRLAFTTRGNRGGLVNGICNGLLINYNLKINQ